MLETQVVVKVHEGLHARPATQFAKLAKEFNSALKIGRGDAWANAKSAVKLMLLGIKQDERILLQAEGDDEREAVDLLTRFLSDPSVIAPAGAAAHPAASPQAGAGVGVAQAAEAPARGPGALQGVPASEGLALGPVFAYIREELHVEHTRIEAHELDDERRRFDAALEATLSGMTGPGGDAAGDEILAALADLACGDDFAGAIRERIGAGVSAASATLQCASELAASFDAMSDEYLRSRADDIRGLMRALTATLLGRAQPSLAAIAEPSIVLAEELSAPDLARADLRHILGIVCTSGSATSHVAIIARAHGIPAVLGLPADRERLLATARVALDGGSGEVWLDHSDDDARRMDARIAVRREQQAALAVYREVEPVTRDGRRIQIAANLGSLAEIEAARQAGAMGVGLFRTELLFMDLQRVPTEDEQYHVYATLAQAFAPWPVVVRPDAGIREPKDLEGKQVGVRAYSVTTGVWTRQVLIDEFGLDSSKVTWVVDDEEHVAQLQLPSNVIHASQGTSLADMMAKGELVAGFAAAAGIGRTGAPTGGWKEVEADYPDLLPNAAELEKEYYARTGVYPMHGTIVVKDSVLAEHPWIAKSLYDAFDQAKREWLARLDAGEATSASDKKYLELRKIVGHDPLPYGIEENRKSIEKLEETAFRQGLTPRRMSMNELFVDPLAN